MWTCPAWIEDALWAAAPRVDRRALVAAIEDRSRRYTSERDRLGDAAGAADLAARAVFFSVADAAKIAVPVAELARAGALPASPWRVLDVGAGCGAMTLGLLAAAGDAALEVDAVDSDRAALEVMRAAVGARAAVRAEVADVRRHRPPAGAYDLVVAGSVLNELPEPERAPLVQAWLAALRPGGAVIVIEPALREVARALHRVRDAVLAAGAYVFAPCTTQRARCPMLEDDRDWCHEDRGVELPPRAAELASATGLREGAMKFSYLVVRAEPAAQVPGGRALRVVSNPYAQKGKLELYGCGDAGRCLVRLLRRNRSDTNRAITRARRGDVLVLGDRDDLQPDDDVELHTL